MKKKNIISSRFHRDFSLVWGFTLIEVLIGLGVFTLVIAFVQLFVYNIFKTVVFFETTLSVQQEMQDTLASASSEIRTMNQSNTGSYPISGASSSSLIFFSDTDGDGLLERIRYFVSATTLKKGVIKPTGSPLIYATSSEVVTEKVHYLIPTTTPVFSYYGDTYTGSETPLSEPVSLSQIQLVKISILAEEQTQATADTGPVMDSIMITPRSLRTNL